jgi:hypothetical protein
MTPDPRNVNPDWLRPDDWPFDEDWGSEAWKDRVRMLERRSTMARARFGFASCPVCSARQPRRTLTCSSCLHRAILTHDQKSEMTDLLGS